MVSDVAVDVRLENLAAELRRHGLEVTGPSGGKPCPGEPDTVYLGVRDPATAQYAEVSLVRHGPDRGDWFLQLSYWTDSGTDPGGLHMADRVRRLLCGCSEHGHLALLPHAGWSPARPAPASQAGPAAACPDLCYILEEGVQRRPAGGPAVMAPQLDRLGEATAHPRITICVMPFTAAVPTAGDLTVFSIPGGTSSTWRETAGARLEPCGPAGGEAHRDHMARLLGLAVR